MCGIVGIAGGPCGSEAARSETVRRMLAMIRHRGPDQCGIYHDSAASLGSVRLSIIDLKTGQQPICSEDGNLWIVYNGEIFNYLELRPDLERRGHTFTTSTDTEVLLHLYEEYGPACLDRLNGQFAFAVWDANNRTLFLARDRLGIRPLFYTVAKGSLLFASEIKALLACPEVAAEFDPLALDQVFVYWSPLPGRTVFRGIRQLPPGHTLTFRDGELSTRRYWRISFPPDSETHVWGSPDRDKYLEEFDYLLRDAIRLRLRSDVPVGAYLSGGIDSSIIAKLAASRTGTQLATFSVAFDDSEFDESPYQLGMSRLLGTRHEVLFATHSDIARAFPSVIWHAETPITRTAPTPLYLLSKLVHDCGFKVVLTGEGADEILGGYDIFKEAAIRQFWARNLKSTIRPALLQRLYPEIAGLQETGMSFLSAFFQPNPDEVRSPFFSHLLRWRNNSRLRRFYSEDTRRAIERAAPGIVPEIDLPNDFESWGLLQRGQYLESSIFLSEYLLSSQGDRVAMAHSVESRLPFLDYRLVEFCNRLPSNMKLRGLRDKYLLRQCGRAILPPEVWNRRKRPYRAPIHRSLFCRNAPDYVRELLSQSRIRDVGLFRSEGVNHLVDKLRTRGGLGETDDMALAGILSTQVAHFLFVSAFTRKPPVSALNSDLKVCTPQLAESA